MIRKRRFDSQSLLNRGGVYPDVRWFNFIALILIAVVGFGFLSATCPRSAGKDTFSALGVPLTSQLATSDLGVLVALILGLLVPLVLGIHGHPPAGKARKGRRIDWVGWLPRSLTCLPSSSDSGRARAPRAGMRWIRVRRSCAAVARILLAVDPYATPLTKP